MLWRDLLWPSILPRTCRASAACSWGSLAPCLKVPDWIELIYGDKIFCHCIHIYRSFEPKVDVSNTLHIEEDAIEKIHDQVQVLS